MRYPKRCTEVTTSGLASEYQTAFNARVGSEIVMDCNGETKDANTNKTISEV
jgi:hypothetical protein